MVLSVSCPGRLYELGQTLGVEGGICVVVTHAAVSIDGLRCGGRLLGDERPPACGVADGGVGHAVSPGDVLWDVETGFEVRCTRASDEPLSFDGRPLVRRIVNRSRQGAAPA